MKQNPSIVLKWFAEHGLFPEAEYRFAPPRKWRFDYAFPDAKLALEVEGGVWTGGRHTRASGFVKDMEKYSTCAIMGWLLIRTTPTNLCTTETIQMIQDALKNRHDQIRNIVQAATEHCTCRNFTEIEINAMVTALGAANVSEQNARNGEQNTQKNQQRSTGSHISSTKTLDSKKPKSNTKRTGPNRNVNGEQNTPTEAGK